MNTNELIAENKMLKKENTIAIYFNTFLIVVITISLIVSTGIIKAQSDEIVKLKASNIQYSIFVDEIKSTKEAQAIDKCKNEDFWKAECLAYELNERKGNN